MSSSLPNLMRSEGGLRRVLALTVLVVVPVLLALVFIAAKFHGLRSAEVWEVAQLARHIAAGDGFVTSAIRPLALGVTGQGPAPLPELYHPPGQAVVLAAVSWLAGSSDKTVAATGGLLWLAVVWLTFLLARRWFSPAIAGVATVFVAGNVALLTASIQGLPHPLLALETTLLAGLLVPPNRRDGQPAPGLPWWRVLLAGGVCGALALTHYLMGLALVVAAAHCFVCERRQGRALLLLGGGFLLVTLPWMIRNLMVVGSPCFSLYWYELPARTARYPFESIWRIPEPVASPLAFVVQHPLQLARKWLTTFARYPGAVAGGVGPVVGFLTVAAVFSAEINRRWRSLLAMTVGGLGLVVATSCLLGVDAALLAAWLPLLAMVAAAELSGWIHRWVTGLSTAGVTVTLPRTGAQMHRHEPPRHWTVGRLKLTTRMNRLILSSLAVGGGLCPLAVALVSRPAPDPQLAQRVGVLQERLAPQALVMSDSPALVAWYANRTAVGLCERETDWPTIEKRLGAINAVYLTPAVLALPDQERQEWWGWLISLRGVYRGLSLDREGPPYGLLRTRSSLPVDAELKRLQAEVSRHPESADAHVRLGGCYQRQEYLRDAADQYGEASRLDPLNLQALVGLWQVMATVRDNGNVLAVLQRAATASPETASGALLLAEAAQALERACAQHGDDPWLLFQAAVLQGKLRRWDLVEKFLKRAAQSSPKTVSPQLMLADLYLQQGLIEQADGEVSRQLAVDTSNAHLFEISGRIRWEQQRYRDAVDAFLRAQRLRPDWELPYLEAGYAYLKLHQWTEATEAFGAAWQRVPHLLQAGMGLAEAYELGGRSDEAIAAYERLVGEFPDELLVLNNLAFLLTARSGGVPRAIVLAEHGRKLFPKNPRIQDTLGWAYYRGGRSAEAVAMLRSALQLAPESSQIREHLSVALHAAGHTNDPAATPR